VTDLLTPLSLDLDRRVDAYDAVADEYYDRVRHPTCADFRRAGRALLRGLLPSVPADESCEVGAGASLLAELREERGEALAGLLITDQQESMLRYSERWGRRGARLAVASASALPVPDESLRLLVGSLADPYDDARFWREARRVLAPGGSCIVTVPSHVWASAFRAHGAGGEAAEFELRSGETVRMPSFVRQPSAERRLIEASGMLFDSATAVALGELEPPLSPKLLGLEPDDPVVSAYVARRPSA
jgi:SAM-dependent methyltransferase